MIKVTLKAGDKTSAWLDTFIMYPQQIFMIQEQTNFDVKSGFFANVIFSTGGQVVAKFKDRAEYDTFVKEVKIVVDDAKIRIAA